MRYSLIIIFTFFLFSCNNQESTTDKGLYQKPDHLLSRKEFTNIFEEVYLVDGAVRIEMSKGVNSTDISRYLYDELFKKYEITYEVYLENLDYYALDPLVMQEIQTEVVNRLTKKESTLTNQ